MPFYAIQSSFAGGEISPNAQGRVDIEKYKTSLKTMRNFLPGINGEVSNRPGTYYIANNDSNNNQSRLISFIFSASDSIIIEMCGSGFFNFFATGHKIGFTLAHPYSDSEIFDVKFTQSGNTLYLVHPGHPPQLLKRITNSNWTLTAYSFINGPFLFPNIDKMLILSHEVPSGFLKSSAPYFQSGMDGTQFKLSQDVAAINVSITYPEPVININGVIIFSIPIGINPLGGTNYSLRSEFPCGNTWRFATAGRWNGRIDIEKSLDLGVTWEIVNSYVSDAGNPSNFNTFGTIDLSLPAGNNGQPALMRVNVIVINGQFLDNVNIQFACDAFTYEKIIVTGAFVDSQHMIIVSQTSNYPYLAIQDTYLWSEGAWSNYRGWPSVVTFTQDRLTFAATPNEPDTLYFTRTSNYIDFGISDPLVDSDGIDVALLSRHPNPIQSIVSLLNMLVAFTGLSEFSVTSTSGAALTPTSIYTQLQGTRGTGKVSPVIIGNKILFLEPQGSCLRELTYQYFTGILDSRNVSLISEHLFRGYSIVDMAYQQEPDSILWLVRSDGTLLSFTYLVEQQFESWARHDVTGILGGKVESVATVPGKNGNEVWLVTKRDHAGLTPQRYIERMLPRQTLPDPTINGLDIKNQYFVDCGSYAQVVDLEATTYPIPWLIGCAVTIVQGGVILPSQVVDSFGNITLPHGEGPIIVGLPITSDLETLDIEYPKNDGTSQGKKYRIGRGLR